MSKHFIKNLIFIDSLSNNNYIDILPYHKQYANLKENLYSIISPNIFLNSYNHGLMYNKDILMDYENSDAVKVLDKILMNKKKSMIECIEPVFSEKYDNSFMYVSMLISLKSEFCTERSVCSELDGNIDKIIKNAISFITKVSNNGIKILSFISLAIFGYYAKIYNNTKNDKYEPKKWMNYLKDIFMENIIDKYINNIVSKSDKKKFILMLIQYSTIDYNALYGYKRIAYIESSFVTKINETINSIPGEVPDQLFIIVYDFLILYKHWSQIIMNICYNYIDSKTMGFISFWLYDNKDDELIIKYYGLEDEYNINELNNLGKIYSELIIK